jgi:hypothetical protein
VRRPRAHDHIHEEAATTSIGVGLELAAEHRRGHGRGKDKHRMIPGWPYSVIAALELGRSSWRALLDAVRLGPGADVTAVTAAQVRELTGRLGAAGQ